jgi:translocator assembly and maintenance protein 41
MKEINATMVDASSSTMDRFFYAEVLSAFPPVHAAFAYGSAVFVQRGYSEARRRAAMTDLVLVVDDAHKWHRANLELNAAHYAWPLAALGGSTIAALQATGAGVYYNTSVQLCGRTVKYGVIECASLLDDLKHWRSLYIAGRAHKPVRPLRELPAELELLVANNLRSALSAALLLLPLRFDDAGLFGTICGLSYSGDVRMGIGESPRKPGDIADGQHDALAELYRGPLAEATGSIGGSVGSRSSVVAAVLSGAASARVQDDRLPARQSLLAALPSVAQDGLVDDLLGMVAGGRFRTHSPHCSRQLLLEASERLWRSSATANEANAQLAAALRRTLFRIVRRASLAQTAKGVLTAGAATSIGYALVKIRGARGSRRE